MLIKHTGLPIMNNINPNQIGPLGYELIPVCATTRLTMALALLVYLLIHTLCTLNKHLLHHFQPLQFHNKLT